MRELAHTVGSPEVTVRRDLNSLARGGLVRRTRGGATVPVWPAYMDTFQPPGTTPSPEELGIASMARELIQPGDAIAIAGGRTTLALALQLVTSLGLTVVTNSLLIAGVLKHAEGIDLLLAGGLLRRPSMELIGPDGIQTLLGLRASTAFLSGDGMTARHGLSCHSFANATGARALAAAANRVVALVDHTGVGREDPFQIAPSSVINDLITGSGAETLALEQMGQAGVRIRLAG